MLQLLKWVMQRAGVLSGWANGGTAQLWREGCLGADEAAKFQNDLGKPAL